MLINLTSKNTHNSFKNNLSGMVAIPSFGRIDKPSMPINHLNPLTVTHKNFTVVCRRNTNTNAPLPEHEYNLVRQKEKYTIQRSETEGMNEVTGPFFNKAGETITHTLKFTHRFCADHFRIIK